MLKKLIVTGAAAGLLLVSAGGAFAGHHSKPAPTPVTTVTVTNNGGIDNTSVNVANTGLNFVSAPIAPKVDSKHHRKGEDPKASPITVTTGDATAYQSTSNGINTSVVGCGCSTTGISTTTVSNYGSVDNLSVNVANSGANFVSGGSLTTGDATAGQVVSNVINTSVGSATP